MRRFATTLAFTLFALPALAAPIPRFDQPRALLEAVYDQVKAAEDWDNFDADAAFDEDEAFSARLSAIYRAADDKFIADGNEMGVLDFSPFIYGQDSGGLTFEIGAIKIKGSHASTRVRVMLGADLLHEIGLELVDDGAAGWKVDDFLFPTDSSTESWRLADYFADPFSY